MRSVHGDCRTNFLPRCLLSAACFLLASLAHAQLFTEIDPGLPARARPCVAWGDYDGDGDLDVLVAGPGKQDASITAIYSNNAGAFSDSGLVVTPLQFAAAAWGDFDGDGDLDLAMIGLTTAQIPTTRIYRNDGASFTSMTGTFTGVYAGTVDWADYDGDGDLDLLVTGVTTTGAIGIPATRLYRNEGHGVFVSVAHPFPNVYLGAVAWADYDRDGDLDVVIAGTDGTGALSATLWRNDGHGSFADAGANLPGMDLGCAAWGDYDGDGDLDLLFGGNSNAGWITRLYRNEGGTLTDANAGLLALLWSSGAWGDYDNDGDADLMIMGYDPVAQVRRSILYRNDAGVFTDSGQPFHDLFLGTLSWVDYDNDHDLDLALSGNVGTNGVDFTGLYRNEAAASNAVPTAPSNLVATVDGTRVLLAWDASSDAQTPAAALTYNVRVGTAPGGEDIVSAQAASNGYRRVVRLGNAQAGLWATVGHLTPGTQYFWSVQAIDGAFAGSAFAVNGSFTATVDPPVGIAMTLGTNDLLRATWLGASGATYQVEASSDLRSWTPAATPAADTNGLFEYQAATGDARFLRAVMP